ncbi:MAG: hypothetical protein LWX07_03040 [Bacteroidetes bacterium]|nr:hypothetical protein [Bacteroidota bacterium]
MIDIKNEYYRYTSLDLNKLEDVVKNYSAPCYVYSKTTITESFNVLQSNLPSKFSVFYAQKSNPNPDILKQIRELGAGCDTASLGEMKSALNAGFTADKIMLTGPAKSKEEIRFAVDNNLLSVNVESVQELELIDKISRDAGMVQDILIRINPPYDSSETTRIIGGTGVSKFGIDIEQIGDFFFSLKNKKNVSLKGIHIFNSSQILDGNKIFANTKNVIDTAIELSGKYSFDVKKIDLGGGFGIPYAADESPLDVVLLGNKLNDLIESKGYKSFLEGVTLIYEPGRYLSGRASIYLVKILYTKTSRGRKILLTDGGIHHMLRPALIGQSHPAINLTALFEGRKNNGNYMVAGPLCTSLDTFGENIELAESKPGDIIAFMNAGAYGYTESMPLFLSHPAAKEIFIQ